MADGTCCCWSLLAFRGSHHPDESLSSRNPSEMPYIVVVGIFPAAAADVPRPAALPLRRRVSAAVPGPRPAGTAADRPGRKRGAAATAGIPGGAIPGGAAAPPLPPPPRKIPERLAARMPPRPSRALVQAVPGSGQPRARLRPPSLMPRAVQLGWEALLRRCGRHGEWPWGLPCADRSSGKVFPGSTLIRFHW